MGVCTSTDEEVDSADKKRIKNAQTRMSSSPTVQAVDAEAEAKAQSLAAEQQAARAAEQKTAREEEEKAAAVAEARALAAARRDAEIARVVASSEVLTLAVFSNGWTVTAGQALDPTAHLWDRDQWLSTFKVLQPPVESILYSVA